MKILQANKAYLPHIGGIETVVRQLAEGFAKAPNTLSSVLACSDDKQGRCQTINGVEAIYCPIVGRVSSLPISPTYRSRLLNSCADVLLIHEPSLLATGSVVTSPKKASKQFGKLVLWWHSDIIRQRYLQPVYRPMFKKMLGIVDAIIVATPNHISSSTMLPEFVSKCHVIHFGHEQMDFASSVTVKERAQALRLEHGRPIVLFVGRLVYYKGAEYLAKAAHLVPDVDFVFVGKGPLRDDLEKIGSDGPARITFIPYLSDDELEAYYEACELFVLPSVENSEAFGLVQLHAMAHGKPVVTSDLPTGVTYVNQDGVTGLVVPKRDHEALAAAINRLIRDQELRFRLGETARNRIAEDFRLDQMISKTLNLFQNL